MERVKWIFALCMILCVGCGSQVESEPTPTPTSTPSPTPTQRLSSWVEPTAVPGAATHAVEKRNVTIQGHRYKYIYYAEYDGSLVVLAAGTDEDTLYIPSKIDGKKVTRVGVSDDSSDVDFSFNPTIHGMIARGPTEYWEADKKDKRKNLVLAEGIETICGNAFFECYFNKVTLPSTLEEIGEIAFMGTHIKEVTVKSKEISIGRGAFSGSTLRKIQFQKGYKGYIAEEAFDRTQIETFDWPDYNDAVENGEVSLDYDERLFPTFNRCKKLKEIRFPENQKLICIDNRALVGCSKLKKLVFPASTKKVVYCDNFYANNYKKSPGELIFLGKNTELQPGSKSYYLKKRHDKNKNWIISTGKIIAPRNSKAIEKAKNVWKIKKLTCGQMDKLDGEYENDDENDAGAPDEFIRGETDVDSEGITYERMNYEYLE